MKNFTELEMRDAMKHFAELENFTELEMKVSREEYDSRLIAIEDALGSVRIEGLEPSKEAIEDARLWAHGLLTVDKIVERVKERNCGKS